MRRRSRRITLSAINRSSGLCQNLAAAAAAVAIGLSLFNSKYSSISGEEGKFKNQIIK